MKKLTNKLNQLNNKMDNHLAALEGLKMFKTYYTISAPARERKQYLANVGKHHRALCTLANKRNKIVFQIRNIGTVEFVQ